MNDQGRKVRIFLFQDMGGLVEDDICAAFSKLSHDVKTYSFKPKSVYNNLGSPIHIPDLIREIEAFEPHFIMGINGNCCDSQGHLSKYFYDKGIPVIAWYVDKPYLKDFEGRKFIPENTLLFFIDRFYCSHLKKETHFPHLYHLPLGTNFLEDGPSDRREFQQDLSFVGRSNLNKIQMVLTVLSRKDMVLLKELESFIDRLVQEYYENPMMEVCHRLNDESLAKRSNSPGPDGEFAAQLHQLVEELVSYKKRSHILEALQGYHLTIFGDHRWRDVFPEGSLVTHRDRAGEFPFPYGSEELRNTYRETRINLNVTRYQIKTGVNQRVFDVPAAGGFLVTDYREEIPDYFDMDREVVCYETEDELCEKVRFYLAHPERRQEIIQAAQQRIAGAHTYEHRMGQLIHTALEAKHLVRR